MTTASKTSGPLKRLASAALAAALIGGCGGGDSGDSTITVSFNPSTLDIHDTQGYGSSVRVAASLNPPPTGNVYPFIVVDKPVLQLGASIVVRNSDGTYSTTLRVDPSLAVGTYTGTLALELCRDGTCTNKFALSGATLPYSITVIPRVSLAVSSAGVALAESNPGAYVVNSGTLVTITSNTPVNWALGSSNGGRLGVVSTTTTTWTGTITGWSTDFVGVTAQSIPAMSSNARQVVFHVR